MTASEKKATRFVTVGHSTDTLEDFISRLSEAGVTANADVRTLPGSTKFPHFNEEVLRVELPEHDISYQRIVDLGGRRNRSKDIESGVNGFWQNRSFHNYADYALSRSFESGLNELIELGGRELVAIMCAEAVWWRCHRRIIADHLLTRNYAVDHLMPNGKLTPATLTPGAVIKDQTVRYPG